MDENRNVAGVEPSKEIKKSDSEIRAESADEKHFTGGIISLPVSLLEELMRQEDEQAGEHLYLAAVDSAERRQQRRLEAAERMQEKQHTHEKEMAVMSYADRNKERKASLIERITRDVLVFVFAACALSYGIVFDNRWCTRMYAVKK